MTHKGLGARAGLLALALVLGAGLAAGPVSAQDKDKKSAPAPKPAAPAAAPAAKPAAPAAAPAAKPAAAATTAAPAAKGGEEAKDQSAWLKLCEKAPTITEPKKEINICLTMHEVLDRTGMPSISAAIREVEGQTKKGLLVMVPLGTLLQAGAQVKVDENEPVKLPFTLCHIAGCTAEAEATPAFIEQMNKGQKIVIAAVDLTGQPKGFALPLKGFDKALVGNPVDNEKYKEARKRLMTQIRERQAELIKKAKEDAAAKGQPVTKQQ